LFDAGRNESYILQVLPRTLDLGHGISIRLSSPWEAFMRFNDPLTRGLIATVAAAMILQAPMVHAGMIGTEAAVQGQSGQNQAELDRAKVQNFVDRANVQEKLRVMGVSGLVAKDRVAALSEQEAHAMAQRIDVMPAGGALSTSDMIVILLIALLVAIVI
jgi:hypothetical protein